MVLDLEIKIVTTLDFNIQHIDPEMFITRFERLLELDEDSNDDTS